jgi:hypothetical protein
MIFYSIGTPTTREFAESINYPELGDGTPIVRAYTPCFIIAVIILAISQRYKFKLCIQVLIILVLIRQHVEFLFVDVLAPRDPRLGYNRVKLWVGTYAIAYQYYIKLEILNSNFTDRLRIPIMLASLILSVYGIARL